MTILLDLSVKITKRLIPFKNLSLISIIVSLMVLSLTSALGAQDNEDVLPFTKADGKGNFIGDELPNLKTITFIKTVIIPEIWSLQTATQKVPIQKAPTRQAPIQQARANSQLPKATDNFGYVWLRNMGLQYIHNSDWSTNY
ncbi:MAG: hypothetical protein LBF38_12795, partial [Deltaproteobacteria bacterium]|nr:hypothetical protein [Deltaproteobacteria bacterium]